MFDAAYKPDLAKVKAAGGVVVNGYISGTYASSTTQPSDAVAAGLGYLPSYEEGAAELVGATRAYGQSVGRKIVAAFTAKGLPLDGTLAVYPAVDTNVPGVQATDCNAGFAGIRDVLAGRVSLRAYAEGAVIDALVTAGVVDGPCWLAAPASWPGFNVADQHVCLVQRVGTSVPGTDLNTIITDPHLLGALWPSGSPYGGFMAITAQDAQLIANTLLNKQNSNTFAYNLMHHVVSADGKTSFGDLLWSAANHATSASQQAGEILTAVQNVAKAVAAVTPGGQVALDTAAVVKGVADAVTSAVTAAMKNLVLKAQ
jgi:hypothetical protein